MQEVGGSIPPGSTRFFRPASPSSRGLGHIPFTDATGVRIPVGTPLDKGVAVVDRFSLIRAQLRRVFLGLLAIFSLLGVCPLSAFAQANFTPYAAGDIEHNSNLYFIPNGTPPPSGGSTRADTVLEGRAGLEGDYLLDRQTFYARAEARRFHYDQFTTNNHSESLVNAGVKWKLGHLLDGVFDYQRERRMVPFLDLIKPTTVILETQNVASGTANLSVTPEWRLAVRAKDSTLDSPRPGAPQLSLHETTVGAGLLYGGLANLSAGFDTVYINGTFRNDPLAASPSYHQLTEGLTANYTIAAHTQFKGLIGYTRRSDAIGGGTSAITGSLEYLRNLTGKTTLNLKLSRGVDSYVTTSGNIIDTSAAAGVSWQATPKITAKVGYDWTQSLFSSSAQAAGTSRTDHFQQAKLDVNYQALRWLSFRAYAHRQTRSSNQGEAQFNATIYGIEFIARRNSTR